MGKNEKTAIAIVLFIVVYLLVIRDISLQDVTKRVADQFVNSLPNN